MAGAHPDADEAKVEMTTWEQKLETQRSKSERIEQERGETKPVIYRADPQWSESHDESFNPKAASLGLYHSHASSRSHRLGEEVKLDVALGFLDYIGKTTNDWDDIVAQVVPNLLIQNMKRSYDDQCNISSLEKDDIRSSLAIDAIFLTSFYLYKDSDNTLKLSEKLSNGEDSKLFQFCDSLHGNEDRRDDIIQDSFLLENQIPLELMKNVICIMLNSKTGDALRLSSDSVSCGAKESLDKVCRRAINLCYVNHIPSFVFTQRHLESLKLHKCHHLLDCAAQSWWTGNEALTQSESDTETNWIKQLNFFRSRESNNVMSSELTQRSLLLTATQLNKYGVEFRGQKGLKVWPKFKQHACLPLKAELLLPTLNFYDSTPKIWRNLLAYETMHSRLKKIDNRKRYFLAYLNFMNDLVQTDQDVSILCSGKHPAILVNCLGDNKAVVDLFNSMPRNHNAKVPTCEKSRWF